MGSRTKLAVIDYGMGNLHSVASAAAHVAPDAEVAVTCDAGEIASADRVIFPGVGAIRDCMAEILRLGIDRVVADAVKEKPVLAICVGMQALLQRSEENGGVDCIAQLPGEVRFFGHSLTGDDGLRLKVPHMGWSRVQQRCEHPLWCDIEDGERFYFVHSYYAELAQPELLAGSCDYGLEFSAALHSHNLFAVQFHPEKSHRAGLQLLKNFMHWNGQD